jgi:hypothetical protein
MELAGLIAREALLAIDGVIGKLIEDHPGDESLRLDIELQLDVVRLQRIDVEGGAEVSAEQGAGGARGGDSEIERVHEWSAEKVLRD